MATVLPTCSQGVVKKERLLELVLAWKERVEGGLGELPKRGPDWSAALGQWLSEIRMDGVKVTPPPGITPMAYCHVSQCPCAFQLLGEGSN